MGNISDTDKLAELGQKIASTLIDTYAARASDAHLAFLPGGISVPTSTIIQAGLINPQQMQQWLLVNFDSPFITSKESCAAHQKDTSRGTASSIYSFAVTTARPACKPEDEAWERISYEIATAKSKLGLTNVSKPIVCEPSDWILPSNSANYWNFFDSEHSNTSSSENENTATSPTPEIPPQPLILHKIDPQFWMVRSLEKETLPTVTLPPSSALEAEIKATPIYVQQQETIPFSVSLATTALSAKALSPTLIKRDLVTNKQIGMTPSITPGILAMSKIDQDAITLAKPLTAKTDVLVDTQLADSKLQIWSGAAATGQLLPVTANVLFEKSTPVLNVTTKPSIATTTITTESTATSETIKIHMEHQCVTLGYYSDGKSWWDNVFLSDRDWYISGMQQGDLLPSLDNGNGLQYGLPIALIVVRNLKITGKWSDEASKALSSPGGTLGPLSLFGASSETNVEDGSITFSHEGMQVIAVLCSPLPVLPPVSSPSEHN